MKMTMMITLKEFFVLEDKISGRPASSQEQFPRLMIVPV